jgi:hypothetical protein
MSKSELESGKRALLDGNVGCLVYLKKVGESRSDVLVYGEMEKVVSIDNDRLSMAPGALQASASYFVPG